MSKKKILSKYSNIENSFPIFVENSKQKLYCYFIDDDNNINIVNTKDNIFICLEDFLEFINTIQKSICYKNKDKIFLSFNDLIKDYNIKEYNKKMFNLNQYYIKLENYKPLLNIYLNNASNPFLCKIIENRVESLIKDIK